MGERVLLQNPEHTSAFFPGNPYLAGQGHLVSRLLTPITHRIVLVISIINLLTKSP